MASGAFGGGTWAFRRSTGVDDVLTYRDYRVIVGLKRKALGGLDSRLEVGYVFGRTLEFARPFPDLDPDDTVMVRVGWTY